MSLGFTIQSASNSLGVLQRSVQTVQENINRSSNPNNHALEPVWDIRGQQGLQLTRFKMRQNNLLFEQIMQTASTASEYKTTASYYEELERALSVNSEDFPLEEHVQNFEESIRSLEVEPTDNGVQLHAGRTGEQIFQELRRIDERLTAIERIAEREIKESINEVNSLLRSISMANLEIARQEGLTTPVESIKSSLVEKVQELKDHIGVHVMWMQDGRVRIESERGNVLVWQETQKLEFDAQTRTIRNSFQPREDVSLENQARYYGGKIGSIGKLLSRRFEDTSNPDSSVGIIQKLRNQMNEFANKFVDDSMMRIEIPALSNVSPDETFANLNLAGQTFQVRVIIDDPAAGPPIAMDHDITLPAAGTVGDINNLVFTNPSVNYPDLTLRRDFHGNVHLQIPHMNQRSDASFALVLRGDWTPLGLQNNVDVNIEDNINDDDYLLAAEYARSLSPQRADEVNEIFEVFRGDNRVAGFNEIRVNQSLLDGSGVIGRESMSFLHNAMTRQRVNIRGSGTNLGTSSYVRIAQNFITDISMQSNIVSEIAEDYENIFSSIQTAYRNDVGVDVDEQSALMLQYQSNYAANAQLISSVNEMLDNLLTIIR